MEGKSTFIAVLCESIGGQNDHATKEKLNSFFQSSAQYVVPFFQRGYVWDQENWETLWEQEIVKGEATKEHFIGTIITKQRQAIAVYQMQHDLIDGQQRLTTVSIALKALQPSGSAQHPAFTTPNRIVEWVFARSPAKSLPL